MQTSFQSSKPPNLIETARSQAKLVSSPIEPSWIIDGDPRASSCLLCQSTDRLAWTMVWECTEGQFDWHYDYDETILILEGRILLQSRELPPTSYGPGDVIFFRKG